MRLDPRVWGGIFALPHPTRPLDKRQLVGFRLCSLVEDDDWDQGATYLGSLTATGNSRWKPGVNEAACRSGKRGRHHVAPVRDCTCGWYAGTNLVALSNVIGGLGSYDDVVLCGVQAWGRIVVHDWGFRSQFARIVTISDQLPSRVIRTVDGQVIRILTKQGINLSTSGCLAAYYSVPVVPLHEIVNRTAEFGDFLEVKD
jgi:hypothetical protein